jgi:hypothetical protein
MDESKQKRITKIKQIAIKRMRIKI